VSNITEESCDLSWRAPVDDGGCPVTHYKVEKKDKTDNYDWIPVHKFCRSTTHETTDLIDGISQQSRFCHEF